MYILDFAADNDGVTANSFKHICVPLCLVLGLSNLKIAAPQRLPGAPIRVSHAGVIHNILTGCPNLEEINYYVLFASLPLRPHQPHTSLKTVRLHLANNEMISSSRGLAIIVETHLNAWCDPVYPNLRRVLLYGTVDLEDGPIRETVQRLRERGCEVAMVSGCDS